MAGKPEDRQMVRNVRADRTEPGEPIHDEEMSVYDNSGSLVVGVTSFGRKLHRLTGDDTVTVEVYDDGIWIDTRGADE